MILKAYFGVWLAVGLSAAAIAAAGLFTELIGVVYGFICFGLTFMGMMGVLPLTIALEHAHAREGLPAKEVGRTREKKEKAGHPIGMLPTRV